MNDLFGNRTGSWKKVDWTSNKMKEGPLKELLLKSDNPNQAVAWVRPYTSGLNAALVVSNPEATGWVFQVRAPDNSDYLVKGEVPNHSEGGRRLAIALCDTALGHEPEKAYVVRGLGMRAVVFAKSARTAQAATPSWASMCRPERLLEATTRAIYSGRAGVQVEEDAP